MRSGFISLAFPRSLVGFAGARMPVIRGASDEFRHACRNLSAGIPIRFPDREGTLDSRNSRGFSLIEILMVVSLVTMISIAIFGVFQSGISALERVTVSSPEEDIQIFFEKFSRDLQNTFHYTGINFRGEGETIRFPTVMITRTELGGDSGIGRATYSYDASEDAIVRLTENMSDLFQEKSDEPVPVLRKVRSLKFQYYEFDLAQKTFQWLDEWNDEDTKKTDLLAVKLEMELEDEGQTRTITKTVAIPISGQPR